ncbi:UDP-N-acetylmuramoyl-tripeptide--D-alanyl-D-alanine ligase [bacterium]|nr:UDP-N-acetylmuramoyl-tripeptide--D-alanyl-D-alanine ligase [bacterium]
MRMKLRDIGRMLGVSVQSAFQVEGVGVDTRSIRPGMLFFALAGVREDGHRYVAEAVGKGAAAVADPARLPSGLPEDRILPDPDPLKALQRLASLYRDRFSVPILAVSGTNGKTTTKEMIAAVLGEKFRTAKTAGNLNNHIGVPLSICAWETGMEAAVLELGINHAGEMKSLCEIARPTHGLITNVGKGHLEFFGSLEGVARAKAELLESLSPPGVAILNGDDPLLKPYRHTAPLTRTFGFSPDCDFSGRLREESGFPVLEMEGRQIRLRTLGRHQAANALAAAAAGRIFDVEWSRIIRALEAFSPADGRGELLRFGDVLVLKDTYNANPSSMEAALAAILSLPETARRAAVLGDMLELGEACRPEHEKLGERIARSGLEAFFSTGPGMRHAAEKALRAGMKAVHHHDSIEALCASVSAWLRPGDGLLVKGSRGMRMERVVEHLAQVPAGRRK